MIRGKLYEIFKRHGVHDNFQLITDVVSYINDLDEEIISLSEERDRLKGQLERITDKYLEAIDNVEFSQRKNKQAVKKLYERVNKEISNQGQAGV